MVANLVTADIIQIEPIQAERSDDVRPVVVGTSVDDRVERVIFSLVLGGLAWVPLWFGSARIFPWAVNAIWFASLAIIYEFSLLFRARNHPFGMKLVRVPAAMFVLVVCWIVVQKSTAVPIGLQHPIYAMASDALGLQLDGSISVNRDMTTLALMRLLTAACTFWLVLQLTRNSERAHLLLSGVGLISATYAAYGMVDLALGGTISGFAPGASVNVVRSTFINQNNFATYAGLGLVANTATLFRSYRHAMPNGISWRLRLVAFLEATRLRGVLELAANVVLITALLLTGSRAGILVGLLGVTAVALLTFGRTRKRNSESLEFVIFIALVVVGSLYLFGDVLVGRIHASGLVDQNRLAVYAITLQAILDAPFTGFGYDTWEDIFPMYRDQSLDVAGRWVNAHNTYLEVLQGLGVIAGAMLIGAVTMLVIACARGIMRRRQGFAPATVGLSAALLVGVHALVDFSLEIQAVTLTFMALLAAGVAQSISSRRGTAD